MKKIFSKILLTISATCVVFGTMLFCGCGASVVLQDVSVGIKAEYADGNNEYFIGSFPYDHYEVVSTYSDGHTVSRDLTKDDIDEIEALKLWNASEHEIVVTIDGYTSTFVCVGKMNDFGDVKLKDLDVTYTGETFSLEIEGKLPEGTKVEFPNGQYFKNAETREVKAVLTCDNYIRKVLYATVNIKPATYDLSSFVFESKKVPYDGTVHTLKGEGTLPKGVSVSYYIGKVENGETVGLSTGNSATEIGKYYVEARFNYTDPNYTSIKSKIEYLEILKSSADLSGLENDLIRQSQLPIYYNGEDQRIDLSPFVPKNDIIDYDKIVKRYYKISEDGTAVLVADGEEMIDAGTYAIELSNFVVKDQYKNQYAIEKDNIFVEYEISPQTVDFSKCFANTSVTYNGTAQQMYFDVGNIPALSTMRFLGYKYALNDKEVDKMVDAGVYNIQLLFSDDKNFYVEPYSARFTIEPYDLADVIEQSYSTDYLERGIVSDDIKDIIFAESPDFVQDAIKNLEFLLPDGEPVERITASGKYVLTAHVTSTNNITTGSKVGGYNFNFTVRKVDLPNDIKTIVNKPLTITYGESLYVAILEHLMVVDDLCRNLDFTASLWQDGVELDYDKLSSGELVPGAGKYQLKMKNFTTDNYFYVDAAFDITINKAELPEQIREMLEYSDTIPVYYNENAVELVMYIYNDDATSRLGYSGRFTDDYVFDYKIVDANENVRTNDEVLESGDYTLYVDGLRNKNYYYDKTIQYKLSVLPVSGLPYVVQMQFNKEFNLTPTDDVRAVVEEHIQSIKDAHPDFEFNYKIYRGLNELADGDIITCDGKNYTLPGTYSCKFEDFSCRDYTDITDIGRLTLNVQKTELPATLKADMNQILKDGSVFIITGKTKESEEEAFFTSAIDAYETFTSKYKGLVSIESLTYNKATQTNIALSEAPAFSKGNKEINFNNITSAFFDLDLMSAWYIADMSDLPEGINEVFTKKITLQTDDDVEGKIENFIATIKGEHPDYEFTYNFYNELSRDASGDKVTYNGVNYYKPGTYFVTITDFSNKQCKNVPYAGTLTVTVEKTKIPDGLELEMAEMLADETTLTLTGTTPDGTEEEFLQNVLTMFETFNTQYAGLAHIESVTVDMDDKSDIPFTAETVLPYGNKAIYFNKVTSERFDVNFYPIWYVVDRKNLPDEITKLFYGEIDLESADDFDGAIDEFVVGITAPHPDFVFGHTVFVKNADGAYEEVSDKDRVEYKGRYYYMPNTYYCVFTDFSSTNYSDISEVGTLTVNVEKGGLSDFLRAEMNEILCDGKLFDYDKTCTLEQQYKFFADALEMLENFNKTFEKMAKISSITYDTYLESNILLTGPVSSVPVGNKDIHFNYITSDIFELDLTSTWHIFDSVYFSEIADIFNKTLTIKSTDDYADIVNNFFITINNDYGYSFDFKENRNGKKFITVGGKEYSPAGTYTFDFYNFFGDGYEDIDDFATLTIIVEKAELPENMANAINYLLDDGKKVKLTGNSATGTKDVIVSSTSDCLEAFDEYFGGLIKVGTVEYDDAKTKNVPITTTSVLPKGDKTVRFTNLTSDFFIVPEGAVSTWTVQDKSFLPDEIKAIFTKQIQAKTSDDLNSVVTDFINNVKKDHPDYSVSFSGYDAQKNPAENSKVSCVGKNYYRTGVYNYVFTSFYSDEYENISDVGTLTITVEKGDLPDELKAEIAKTLEDGKTYSIAGNTNRNAQSEFIESIFNLRDTFNEKFGGGIASLNSLLYDSETASGAKITSSASVESGDKTIFFTDFTSDLFNINLCLKWNFVDKEIAPDEVRAIYTTTFNLHVTEDLNVAWSNYMSDMIKKHPEIATFTFELELVNKDYNELTENDFFMYDEEYTHSMKPGTYHLKLNNFWSPDYREMKEFGDITLNLTMTTEMPTDIKELFTGGITIKTTDDIYKAIEDYIDNIKATNYKLRNFEYKYELLNDEYRPIEEDEFMVAGRVEGDFKTYKDKTYIKPYNAPYHASLTDFSGSSYYYNVAELGMITINVELADIPADIEKDVRDRIQDGRRITITNWEAQKDWLKQEAYNTVYNLNMEYSQHSLYLGGIVQTAPRYLVETVSGATFEGQGSPYYRDPEWTERVAKIYIYIVESSVFNMNIKPASMPNTRIISAIWFIDYDE